MSSEASSGSTDQTALRLALAEGLLTSLRDTTVNPALALGAARELLHGRRDRRELTRAQALDALEAFAKPLRAVELEEAGRFTPLLHPHDRKGRFRRTFTQKRPATAVEGAADLASLQDRWAKLDRDLLPFAGEPQNPQARKIIAEQQAIQKVVHHLRLDEGTPEGVGKPGGPRDVVIVGAGPAGISAAIYGGTEGLDTLLVDANTDPGGQARMSSRIENVIGFPAGVTGRQYAQMGLEQAQRTGAETRFGTSVTGMSYDAKSGLKTLTLSDGSTVDARSVIIAGGVQFRTLQFPGSDSKGVIYGDSAQLKEITKGKDAVIVGGANSAGQAAIDTASTAKSVSILIRHGTIRDQMSEYLVQQLEGDPKVHILEGAETASIQGGPDGMESVTLKDGRVLPAAGALFAIGSAPKTDWASGVDRDDHGFLKVGGSGDALETSVPGVFAAGDVRSGSIHRVITAAADGATAIAQTHGFLSRMATPTEMAEADVAKQARAIPDDEADTWMRKLNDLDTASPFTGAEPPAKRKPAKRKRRKLKEARSRPEPPFVPDEYVPTDERGEPVGKDPKGPVPPRPKRKLGPRASALLAELGTDESGRSVAALAQQTPLGVTSMISFGVTEATHEEEDDMDPELSEASVHGNPPVPNSPSSQTGPGAMQLDTAGGPNAAVLAAIGLPWLPKITVPPNLHKVDVNEWESCSNCVFFNKGGCNLYGIKRPPLNMTQYGAYPVDRDDLCDDYRTLSQPEDRTFGQMVTVVDRLSEALDTGDTAEITRARARFEALDARLEEVWSPAARAAALIARRRNKKKLTPGHPAHVHIGFGERHGIVPAGTEVHFARRVPDAMSDPAYRERRKKIIAQYGGPRRTIQAELSEVKSDAYPGLDRSPKKNWVDNAGGLPRYIERIAKHLHYEKGKEIGHAIAIAVNVVKKMCASGDTNFPGKQNVNAGSRAQACKAVAEWEAKKAKSRGKTAVSEAVLTSAARAKLPKSAFAIPESESYPIHDEAHARNALSRVSQHGSDDEKKRVRAAVKRRYPEIGETHLGLPEETWPLVEAIMAEWEPTAQFLERLGLAEAAGSWPLLPSWPFVEKLHTEIALVEGHRDWMVGMALDVGVEEVEQPPVKDPESRLAVAIQEFQESWSDEARAAARLARKHGGSVRKFVNMPDHPMHGDPLDVHVESEGVALVSHPNEPYRRFTFKVSDLSEKKPPGKRSFSEASAEKGDVASTSAALAEAAGWKSVLHPRGRKGLFREIGYQHQRPSSSPMDDLSVDNAVGAVLGSFDGVKDWNIEPGSSGGSKHWDVHIDHAGGHSVVRVTEDGKVNDVGDPSKGHVPAAGVTPAAPEPKGPPKSFEQIVSKGVSPQKKAPAYDPSDYEDTGDVETPSHMAAGTIYKGSDGIHYKHEGDAWKGKVKGYATTNLKTGTKKFVPYFAVHGKEYEIHQPKGAGPVKPKPAPPDTGQVFDDLMKSVGGKAASPPAPKFVSPQPSVSTFKASAGFKTGRGPTGKLRNFKAMGDAKFKSAFGAIKHENNDPEAWEAAQAEWKRRFGSMQETWSDAARAASALARRGRFTEPVPPHVTRGPWGYLAGTANDKDIKLEVNRLRRLLAALSPSERHGERGEYLRASLASLVGERQFRRLLPSAILAARIDETRVAITEAVDHAEITRLRARESVLVARQRERREP